MNILVQVHMFPLTDIGHVFVWGHGIIGKGPKAQMSVLPSQIPPPLFGQNNFNTDVKVTHISCGITHFAALTSTDHH